MFRDIRENFSWQNSLVRFVAVVSIVGTIFVTVVIFLAVAQPNTGSSLAVSIATVLSCVATGIVGLLFAGTVFERENLGPRLPKVTIGRLVLGLFGIAIFLPIQSLAFIIGIAALCICGVFLSSRPVVHLRGVAVCDALLCLGVSEVMRRTRGWDDGGVSRTVHAIYALMGVLLCGLFCVTSVFRMPLLNKILFCMSSLAALHAGSIVLSGISTVLLANLDSDPVNFSTDYCIESTIRSPVSAIIKAFQDAQRDVGNWTGTTTPPPCAVFDAPRGRWPEPSDAGIWATIVFATAGVYGTVLVLAYIVITPGVKVAPEGHTRRNSSKEKLNKKPKLTKEATKQAFKKQHAKCVACCRAFVTSLERLIGLLVLLAALGGLVLLGHMKLKDSLASERRRLEAANSTVTAHATVANAKVMANATVMATATEVANAKEVTWAVGLSPPGQTKVQDALARKQRRLEATSDAEMPIYINDTNDTNDTNETDTNATTTTTTTTAMINATIASMTTTTTTTTSTIMKTTVIASLGQTMDDPVPTRPPVVCSSPPPDTGEPPSRPEYTGLLAWSHVPADRMGVLWCEYGEWAAVAFGALIYCCHVVLCSLTMKKWLTYSTEEQRRRFNVKMARARTKSKDSGVSKDFGDEKPSMDEVGFRLDLMAKKDPRPEYLYRDMDGRIFDV